MKKSAEVYLIALSFFILFIDFAGANTEIDEMRRVESAYVEASSAARTDHAERFQQLLMTNIQASERSVRRRATYLANLYFADSTEMLSKLISLLEPETFSQLSPQARINAMHLIRGNKENAWTPKLADRIKTRVKSIEDNPPDSWGSQQKQYFAEMREMVGSLPTSSDAAWAFGIIQDRNEKTRALTDIDVFVCKASANDETIITKAQETAKHLANSDFGRVRLKRWPENGDPEEVAPKESQLRGFSTLYYDAGHPEELLVVQVEKVIQEVELALPFRKLPNKALVTPWYLSLFICK